MNQKGSIGLVGDYDEAVPAHRAIPLALRHAAQALDVEVGFEWIATDQVTAASSVSRFDGLWCVPASPYRNMDGALLAIRHARENAVPFLGTCGGFHRCRYGLNPAFQAALLAGPLRAAADDEAGEIRAVELDAHPFFVATLFQPERAALAGKPAPLVVAFVASCAA